jgi:predicted phosphodiesterase
VFIGILADSHGHVNRLRKGIQTLKRRGAELLLHLGDVTDTLRLETVDECIDMLILDDVTGVMGNHEYSLATHHFKRYPSKFSESAKDYIKSLPYRLEIANMCFTHFSPFGGVHGLYAPTDAESYEATLLNSTWPVLVNGHSHDPRIYHQLDDKIESVRFEIDKPFRLGQTARYILTCGALEDWYCAFLDSETRCFEVVTVER